jgi:hypothetical protein
MNLDREIEGGRKSGDDLGEEEVVVFKGRGIKRSNEESEWRGREEKQRQPIGAD